MKLLNENILGDPSGVESTIDALVNLTAIGTAANTLVVTNDIVRFDSTNANDPLVLIKNTANDATSGRFRFLSARGADGQDDDEVGIIQFYGYDDGTPSGEEYATIKGTIHDATAGQESGRLQLQVASHDGGTEDGLVLTGGSVDAEVDVTIGLGAASVTTIAGTLTMGSTAFVNNTGVIQVATQGTIDHDSLANFASNEHYTQANIVATGVLNSGSINTSFGNINNGSSTLTSNGVINFGGLPDTGGENPFVAGQLYATEEGVVMVSMGD